MITTGGHLCGILRLAGLRVGHIIPILLKPTRRFFSNAAGTHAYGPSIFTVERPAGDVAAAWTGVSAGFDAAKFGARGGVYEWGQGASSLAQQQARWAGGQADRP